jgi:hypothetical protein
MPKNVIGRWLTRLDWGPAKPLIPDNELPAGALRRRLAQWTNGRRIARKQWRLWRIGTIRSDVRAARQYPLAYRHKIVKYDLAWRGHAFGGHISGLPFVLTYQILHARNVRAATRSLIRSSYKSPLDEMSEARNESLPVLAEYLLLVFLDRNDRISIIGDLREEFTSYVFPRFGLRRARLWYWI